MEFKIKKAAAKEDMRGTLLYFLVEDTPDVNKVNDLGEKAEGMTLTLVKKRGKSRNANNYMWVLCDEIAKVIGEGMTKEEVYRLAIKDVGIFLDMTLATDKVDEAIKMWEADKVGWFAENHYETETVSVVRFYKGSSVYNGEEMNRLVTHVVEMADELGINTITPDEQRHLIDLWGRHD